MRRVFVSGCYDILHAGHLQFFEEARALGDHLTVCFASAEVLWRHKHRRSSLPDQHKLELLRALRMVDEAVMGCDAGLGLDFESHFRRIRPAVLAVTEDDRYEAIKRQLCAEVGAEYVALAKTPPKCSPVSTTSIVRLIRAPETAPLRVDFAGGWLDVPRFAREEGFVVNCAISPTVSLVDWPYARNAGLGGSGAWALLNGHDGVLSECGLGVGWQDPAVIAETGLCVYRSGQTPRLFLKTDGELVRGKMALFFTGRPHDTPSLAAGRRDYGRIVEASRVAHDAVRASDLALLGRATHMSYSVQLDEGMERLPYDVPGALGFKYCGGGFGGYALYLFPSSEERDAACAKRGLLAVEPFVRHTLEERWG